MPLNMELCLESFICQCSSPGPCSGSTWDTWAYTGFLYSELSVQRCVDVYSVFLPSFQLHGHFLGFHMLSGTVRETAHIFCYKRTGLPTKDETSETFILKFS